MAGDLPFYKMYPADADTNENFRLMSYEQRGLYWTALNHSWRNDGLPIDPDELRTLFALPKTTFDKIWTRVSKCFESDGQRLRNPRQEEERTKAISKSNRATNSIRTRYERSTNVDTNVGIRASDSESVSGSEVLKPNQEKENPKVLAEDNAKLFAHFQQAYIETGKSMIAADFAKCRFDWDRLDGFQKLNAIAGVRARIEAGTAQYLPSPRNYILDSEWTRKPEQPRNGRAEPTPQQSEAYLKRFPLATGEKE